MPGREQGIGWGRAAAGLAALVVLLVGLWAVQRFVVMENLDTVVPGELYRSGQPSPDQLEDWIDAFGLNSVLRLKGDGAQAEAEREVLARRGVELIAVRLSGQRPPTRRELLDLLDALARAPRPLLVHCDAGADRTGLAAALALLLQGQGVSDARSQFALRYRHLGALLGSPLSDVLDEYASWLGASGSEHSPERLRAWIRYVYVPLYYAAQIDVPGLPAELPAGEPTRLRVRVTNASPHSIPLGDDPRQGVALGAVISSRADRIWWAETPEEQLESGESRELEIDLPPLDPGVVELRLDLAEDDGTGDLRWFQRMGSEPFQAWLHVTQPGSGAVGAAEPAARLAADPRVGAVAGDGRATP